MKLKWSVHKDSDYCLCVPNFLSDDEIKHFRTINKDQKFLRAGTRHSGYNPNIRNTWRKHQVKFPYWDRLMKIVDEYNFVSGYNFDISHDRKHGEVNHLLYNAVGDHFIAHRDHRLRLESIAKKEMIRKISCTIQMTEGHEYEGSDLEVVESMSVPDAYSNYPLLPDFLKRNAEKFRHKFPELRDKGTLVMFTSIHEHTVTPLISGARESIVVFVRGKAHAY
jgi:predicted 2-oxoglutarate/Fe(II)-dependent dioxygenase YbiX